MTKNDYLKRLGKCISNASVLGEILDEYEAHIDDCIEALMENGMSKKEAEAEAVRQMGNPEEAGNEMDQIHARVFDLNMFWWMLAFAVVIPVFEIISRLITSGDEGIIDILNYDFGMYKVPVIVHLIIGTAIICYGSGLSIIEKYTGKPLFYSYGRNWNGGYIANSGLVLAIGGIICSAALPVKGFIKGVIGVIVVTVLNMVIRVVMNVLRNRRERKYLWEIGFADTDINWKGKGTICNGKMKVRARNSEKGTVIHKGEPIMVVSMEGFKPVVIAV